MYVVVKIRLKSEQAVAFVFFRKSHNVSKYNFKIYKARDFL